MAPPNRGVSKAVLPPARQPLSRSIPTPVPTLCGPTSNNIVAPHINSSGTINASSSSSSSSSTSRSAITIPYPTASAGSLESSRNNNHNNNNNQLLRDPSLSYITGFDPYEQSPSSLSPDSTPYFTHHHHTTAAAYPELHTFNSPISPAQLYSAESQSDSLSLFQSNHSLEEASMFTDTSSPHGTNSVTFSSPHSSQEPNYTFGDHPFSSSTTTHSPYTTTNSAFMYNPTETAAGRYSAAHSSSMSSSDDMDTDNNNNTTTGSGQYLYNFDGVSAAPSPQGQDDDPDYIPSSTLKSPTSSFAKTTAASSKEKEQNKQKLYRNRKSEFTNRMRDELLEMNLLPHSRITHAPEIMSKTADTLRDYRELLLLIRDQVDGMPENLASVPGAIRKLLNENGQMFNNVKPPSSQQAAPTRSMKGSSTTGVGDYKPPLLHVTPIQPLPFRATGGTRHGTY